MNKFGFKENLDKGISPEEIIKTFFAQICDDGSNTLLNSLIIKKIDCLPLSNANYKIYAVCTQSEIDKLISFDSDYMYYNKLVKTIKPSIKCVIYNITYSESWGEVFGTIVDCTVIKKTPASMQVRNVIIAEDELVLAQQALNNINGVLY